jgi:arylsulfatase A-like enzyme
MGGDERGAVGSYFGPFPMPGLENRGKEHYLTEELTAGAEKFIGDSAQARQPFFLYLPHYAVHTPLDAREEAVAKYRAKSGNKDFPDPRYPAMVESFDQSLGRIRKKLAEAGVAKNTVIIVTSDNGGLRYEGTSKKLVTDNSPLRAGKGHLYEGGIRAPLIVYWPGVTKAGAIYSTPVSSIDLFPTVLDMTGVPSPSRVDGVSLAGLLRNGRAPQREELYWHYPNYSNQGGVPSGAVRLGDWKLIEFYEDGRLELFNLKSDPGEKRNMSKAEPSRTAALHALLNRWRSDVNATMPAPNPAYDPAKADQGLTGAEPVT